MAHISEITADVNYIEEQLGDGSPVILGWSVEASPASVLQVLGADEGTGHGRSKFEWLRLQNGDLILGVWPHGDTYESVSENTDVPRGYTI